MNLPFFRDPKTSESLHRIEQRIRDNKKKLWTLQAERDYFRSLGHEERYRLVCSEIRDLREALEMDLARHEGLVRILDRFNEEKDPDPFGIDTGRSTKYGFQGPRSRNTGSPKPRGD